MGPRPPPTTLQPPLRAYRARRRPHGALQPPRYAPCDLFAVSADTPKPRSPFRSHRTAPLRAPRRPRGPTAFGCDFRRRPEAHSPPSAPKRPPQARQPRPGPHGTPQCPAAPPQSPPQPRSAPRSPATSGPPRSNLPAAPSRPSDWPLASLPPIGSSASRDPSLRAGHHGTCGPSPWGWGRGWGRSPL